ncbi:sigma-54 dependent transcriptional regulator [uncultured Thiodictyon sp.]|uniref:sigma-54-dependent transcriptional regulator n=1 Tax=uncultured Thiodictyon sp. TaxID=1846217 RepID=UPI0025EE5E3D|nr:sigma-54 dependent transcriptional regulator [uncultured Thiodictyon sp.]
MTNARPSILVVDGEALSLDTLRSILADEFDVHIAPSVTEAERCLERDCLQAVIADQRLPEMRGMDFLARVRERWPNLVRLILCDHPAGSGLIDGVTRVGIYQFITKPWHPDQLLLTVRNACRLHRLQRENDLLALEMRVTAPTLEQRMDRQRAQLKRNFRLDSITRSPDSPLNRVCEQVAQVAPYDVPVLLTGESGTGKELFARALHYNSPRADRPFVAENCAALADDILESELFGHEKGAFTGAVNARIGLFEQADGGTIFLDEIGEVSPAFQVKLLRVLQEGEVRPVGSNRRRRVDVRVVAATNRDLARERRAGRFREDLYYRLAGLCLHLPPLRDRRVDIPLIARSLLEELTRTLGKACRGITDDAMVCLQTYDWPGNVRELRNEIQRMLIMAPGDLLGCELLDPRLWRGAAPVEADAGSDQRSDPVADPVAAPGGLKEQVEALEERLVREALDRHGWNKSQAAESLGLSRVGLRNKLERYGLAPKTDA